MTIKRTDAHERGCDCTPETAWEWVEAMTQDALAGDKVAIKLLPRVVHHALLIGANWKGEAK